MRQIRSASGAALGNTITSAGSDKQHALDERAGVRQAAKYSRPQHAGETLDEIWPRHCATRTMAGRRHRAAMRHIVVWCHS